VTVDCSPSVSLWPLGGLCSWFRMVTFWPMRLSVILLPRSSGFLDGVLCLGVSDGGVVSDARVGADERVGAYFAVVSDYDGASDGCSAMDDISRAENAPV